jgi:hypothetical protein
LLWAFAAVAGVYLYFFPYYAGINNPNENVRLYLVRALVDHQSFAIDPVLREWGYVNDRSVFAGKNYSAKAPGTSLTGVPVYYVQKHLFKALGWQLTRPRITYAARLFAVVLPVLAFLFAFGKFLEGRGASPFTRDLAVIGLALGTPMAAYSVCFVAHAQVAICAFGSFMLIRRAADLDWEGLAGAPTVGWRLALAGFLAGWATITEYQIALVAAVLTVYAAAVLRHRRRLAWLLLGALPTVALLLVTNALCFGGPLEFSYAHLENASFAHNTQQGLLGFASINPGILAEALGGRSNGLFYYSPLCLLGLVGAVVALGRRRLRADGALVLAAFALPTLYLAGLVAWRAGWSVGPRYITVVLPFLVYGVVLLFLPRTDSRATRVLTTTAAALCLTSVVISGVAVIYPHYPQAFRNPPFSLAWPLVREGYLPYSFGWLVGLRGLRAGLPLVPFILAAVALVLAGDGRPPLRARVAHALGAVAVAAGLIWLATLAPNELPGIYGVHHMVRSKWEPTEGLPKLAPLPTPPARPAPPRPAPRPAPPRWPVALRLEARPLAPSRAPSLAPRAARLALDPRLDAILPPLPLLGKPAPRAR